MDDDFHKDIDKINPGLDDLGDGIDRSFDELKAHRRHAERSKRARSLDEQKQDDDVTTDYSEWASDPDRHDFPHVDDKKGGRLDLDVTLDDL